MVDWLNNNIKLSTNLDKWLQEELIVTIEDMFYIFKTDYTRGVHRILSNSIQKDTAPFKRLVINQNNFIFITKKNGIKPRQTTLPKYSI